MTCHQKNTATSLFKGLTYTISVLLLSGCFESLSGNSGLCSRNSDCLGAETCVANRCQRQCFQDDDCEQNQACVINRCEELPHVLTDAGENQFSDAGVDSVDLSIPDAAPRDTQISDALLPDGSAPDALASDASMGDGSMPMDMSEFDVSNLDAETLMVDALTDMGAEETDMSATDAGNGNN